MKKQHKDQGDPFEPGDPVWAMNLGGKNREGVFGRFGFIESIAYVRVSKGQKAGWWVETSQVRHRYQGDGIRGEVPSVTQEAGEPSDPDPLMR